MVEAPLCLQPAGGDDNVTIAFLWHMRIMIHDWPGVCWAWSKFPVQGTQQSVSLWREKILWLFSECSFLLTPQHQTLQSSVLLTEPPEKRRSVTIILDFQDGEKFTSVIVAPQFITFCYENWAVYQSGMENRKTIETICYSFKNDVIYQREKITCALKMWSRRTGMFTSLVDTQNRIATMENTWKIATVENSSLFVQEVEN